MREEHLLDIIFRNFQIQNSKFNRPICLPDRMNDIRIWAQEGTKPDERHADGPATAREEKECLGRNMLKVRCLNDDYVINN